MIRDDLGGRKLRRFGEPEICNKLYQSRIISHLPSLDFHRNPMISFPIDVQILWDLVIRDDLEKPRFDEILHDFGWFLMKIDDFGGPKLMIRDDLGGRKICNKLYQSS